MGKKMEREEPVLVPVKQVLSLIRDHYDKDDESFRKNAEWLCNYLYEIGEDQLAEYIFVQMNPSAGWVPM